MDRKSKVAITGVEGDSIAAAAGIERGDFLVSLNGEAPRDILDYRFLCADDQAVLEVERDGTRRKVRVAKHPDRDLGLEFADVIFDRVRRCRNHCVFCFVDQLPRGLRRGLYLKDDDYRLSFLHGNFLTLTNLTQGDMDRLSRQRLSPLYVSVHATDPEVRSQLLGNPRGARIMDDLSWLVERGITVHAQVVLCPGINDGEILERTVDDLAGLWPGVASVGVVPVAVGPRANPSLRAVTPWEAVRLVSWATRQQRQLLDRLGSAFLHVADELYLAAEHKFPPMTWYEDFPHLDNGAGMVPLFRRTFRRGKPPSTEVDPAVVVTGELFAPVLRELVMDLPEVEVLAVRNQLFGTGVTVAGLLGGADVGNALRGMEPGRRVLLPDSVLRDGLFLDDVSLDGLAVDLGLNLQAIPPTGEALARALGGGKTP